MPDPVPPDSSLLVLEFDEEVFLKAATNIEDTEELRSHIHRIAREAFEVFPYGTISSYTFTK